MVEANKLAAEVVSKRHKEVTPYADLHFWAKYELYVEANKARHGKLLEILSRANLGWVLDLGCGQVMEGRQLSWAGAYLGVDVDPSDKYPGDTLKANYRTDLARIKGECSARNFAPDTILSLFSIEPTGDDAANEGLYQALMIRFPSVRQIISAGFYYEDKEFDQWVTETGGLKSHQTSQFTPLIRDHLKEIRLYQHAPSELFGDKVIEAWRLIERA